MQNYIEVYGARAHNLKDIDVKIPRDQLVVITGLSGSGKSSLAFDTIYAEGQRRYIETFSAYARQFLGSLERPDVDKIEGLSPVIAIEQKTTNKNPRSTVGTITEIYDYLRLLYARASDAYSPVTNKKMVGFTVEQMIDKIKTDFSGKKILILAPVVRSRKGHYRELFETQIKQGVYSARIDGEITELTPGMQLDRYKLHDIELLIDKLVMDQSISDQRLQSSVNFALMKGKGAILIVDVEDNKSVYLSKDLMCPESGISFGLPEPNSFSFNSPKGSCPSCKGLGRIQKLDMQKLIPDPSLPILKGLVALELLKSRKRFETQIGYIFLKHKIDLETPFSELPKQLVEEIFEGSTDHFKLELEAAKITKTIHIDFEGIQPWLEEIMAERSNPKAMSVEKKFTEELLCPTCNGTRLNSSAMAFRIDEKTISEVSDMGLENLFDWITQIENTFPTGKQPIASPIIKEIKTRL